MQPLVVVACLFAMSLSASIILFGALKNTAVVKLPFGRFGGGIAGFIGVFLILQHSYKSFADTHEPPTLNVPSGYEVFVSEIYGIGLAYPKSLKLEKMSDLKIIGTLRLGDKGSNILVGLQAFPDEDFGKRAVDDIRKEILDQNVSLISKLMKNVEIVSRTPFSVSGVRGETQEFKMKVVEENVHIVQVMVPNFEKKAVYVFNLTSRAEFFEDEKDQFNNILSTVKFF